MALAGEGFLSAVVQTLVENIASTKFRDSLKKRKLNTSLLDELKIKLLALNAVLNDAEMKQITNPAVKDWLDELKDAVLDAEDLFDQINTNSLRSQLKAQESQSVTNQVRNLFSSPFNQFYRETNSKMEELSRRLDYFSQQKDILGLQKDSGIFPPRRPTSSFVNESFMVGRAEDKKKLKNMLLADDDGANNDIDVIGVLTILGMGGVGKTTLAQLLYNDKEVQNRFELRAWACVSEDFDVIKVTKTLLESVNSKSYDSNNLDFLRGELKRSLGGKKFLFVLDDLWNEKYSDWDDLQTSFTGGKVGSKVIITTRQQKVADVTHTFPIHRLGPLSDEDCWALLAKHAFGREDSSRSPELDEIGKKIAKKCGGLPIAAKTLGGLLRSEVDPREWNKILNSNIWDIPSDDVLPALRLSYLYLPAHLKRCFAYCSIFPKDYELDRKQLVLLWMAEGFIQKSKSGQELEEIGDDYFVGLLSRSLIQQSKGDEGQEVFVMHDLVNDLARTVSGKCCFRFDFGEMPTNARHFSYNMEVFDSSKKFENFCKLKCLRSFLPLTFNPWYTFQPYTFQPYTFHLTRKVLEDLLPTYRSLRVLSMSRYENITQLPDSISNLVQLRYLNLSYTKIKSLPDAACMLCNLQTLNLSNCSSLTELPADIGKLVSLRHLDISGTSLKELPMQIVGLKNLRTLTVFVVGKQQEGLRVRELKRFPHLRGKLQILNLNNVTDPMDAFDANMKGKVNIEELMLEWSKNGEQDSRVEKDVIEQLQPSTNVRELTIKCYGGTSFPRWLGDSSFSNMLSLRISECKYCMSLPPLGQLPSLKKLYVGGMELLEIVGPEFYGEVGGSGCAFQPFPSLELLEFKNMSNWKEWLLPFESEGRKLPFPHLKSLHLLDCSKLKGQLPQHLPSLTEFQISECFELKTMPSTLQWITSIKKFTVWKEIQGSLMENVSQCSLEDITIRDCNNLPSLPKMIVNSNGLRNLSLYSLPSITSFPKDGLPTSLASVSIYHCKNLAFLPHETWRNYKSLSTLSIIYSCDSLVSFPLDCFPVLKDLRIINCSNLQSLSISESSMDRPSSLQSLNISGCGILRSLSERIHTLTTLQSLHIYNSPNLLPFGQGGLPPNLRTFVITGCGRQWSDGITDCGLQRLTSLSYIRIDNGDVVKYLLKEQMLPSSLTSLLFSNVSDTKLFDENGFRLLASLETLLIEDCERLECLPEDGLQHLTSLKRLYIRRCERLESLAKHTLPPSLFLLSIEKCPLLEARYQSERGKHWSEISHIPVIEINDKVII